MMHNFRRICFIVVFSVMVTFSIAFFILFFREGYPKRIIARLHPTKEIEFVSAYSNRAVDAWDNCLRQLNLDSDIVFFGDSIIRRGDFSAFFPDKTVCNLGLGSDTLNDMIDRVSMIASVSPDDVFVMGGINSLRNDTLDRTIQEYDNLLNHIASEGTHDIFVLSVLPISSGKSNEIGCSAETIRIFNDTIQMLADSHDLHYIDLYRLFCTEEGSIKPEMTTDGVHLSDEGYQVFADEISNYIT